ncbi:MAG: hypothetical protein WAL72_17995 [Streptosporangiaceae bacterium]
MRRNASTVVVLPGPAPAEVLAAVGRSMNVALIRPPEPADDDYGFEAAAGALQQAGRSTSAYALVPADPLAALAASWRAMWDVSRPEGPDGFEAEALKVLTAWRSGRFELPDYYLVLGPGPAGPAGHAGPAAGDQGPDFYLGPLRTTRPQRVAVVAATEPTQQAVGVLHALGSLPYGPWWPGLDKVIEAARTFYPGQLAGGTAATG